MDAYTKILIDFDSTYVKIERMYYLPDDTKMLPIFQKAKLKSAISYKNSVSTYL